MKRWICRIMTILLAISMIGESALSNPDGYTLGDLAAELGIGQTVE